MEKKKKTKNIVRDKNGNPIGIAIPTRKEDCEDKIDEAFAPIFAKYF